MRRRLFRRAGLAVTILSVAGVTHAVAASWPATRRRARPPRRASRPRRRAGTGGYWLVGADGNVYPFGVPAFGRCSGTPPARPIVGAAGHPTVRATGWSGTDGGIFSFGDARFFGSTGATRLNKPIVGMAATPSGGGYWLVASDGGIFSFGDARFFGSTGAMRLNKPIVGMAATPSGAGYWLVASDGGIFAFGDAGFYGSTGNIILNKPITGMSASRSGRGYRFVASDGGLFSFGDAPYAGSAAGRPAARSHRRHGRVADRQRLLAGRLHRHRPLLRRRQQPGLDGRQIRSRLRSWPSWPRPGFRSRRPPFGPRPLGPPSGSPPARRPSPRTRDRPSRSP